MDQGLGITGRRREHRFTHFLTTKASPLRPLGRVDLMKCMATGAVFSPSVRVGSAAWSTGPGEDVLRVCVLPGAATTPASWGPRIATDGRFRRRLDYLPEKRVLCKKENILDVMACFGRFQRPGPGRSQDLA